MHLRHLSVLQNWDCHSCTNCCREYHVPVTEEERRRFAAQQWEKDPRLRGLSPFVRHGPWWAPRYRLAHRDGGCIFLGADQRCLIHQRFGAEAKPLACRLFPFVLVPAGDHWRVGLRFACPSAAANQGRRLTEHHRDLTQLARLLARQEGIDRGTVPPPALQGRQRLDWAELFRLLEVVTALLGDRRDRVERRWRKCLTLAALCRQARLDHLSGPRLSEFLDVLTGALEDEAVADPADVPAPSWVGRVLFRQVALVYGRRDQGLNRGEIALSRLTLLRAGWRFARGRGEVPRVNGLLREGVTFAGMEAPAGPPPAAAEEVLER
jgi:lysine-N-methylase